jgi:DNA-binding IclR family transcriptional regulator
MHVLEYSVKYEFHWRNGTTQMSTLKTLDRGLQALWTIARHPEGISIAGLAGELDVDRAIAYRIAATLEGHGLLTRRKGGQLVLGASVLELERRYLPQLRIRVRPALDRLAQDTRATAFISVAQLEDCAAIAVSEPDNMLLRVGYREGSTHPLSRGAAGVAILAGRDPAPEDSEAVRHARAQGYSVTHGQLQAGAIGVACPLTANGLNASVGVVAMQDLNVERAVAHVRSCAEALRVLISASSEETEDTGRPIVRL